MGIGHFILFFIDSWLKTNSSGCEKGLEEQRFVSLTLPRKARFISQKVVIGDEILFLCSHITRHVLRSRAAGFLLWLPIPSLCFLSPLVLSG